MSDIVKRLRDRRELRIVDMETRLEAADTIEIMAREIADLKAAYEGCCKDLEDAEVTCAELDEELADLKAQHLLTQAEEMHRVVAAANEPSTTPGVPLRPDPGVPHTRGGTPL